MDSTTSAPPRAGRFPTEIVVAILCLGSFSGALMQSLVIPIQAELPQLLGTSAGNASWAVTATLLAAAVTMPVTGRLADLYGKKVVLCASAAVLAVGSLVAAVAGGLPLFLIGRALQGMAMGYIPVAISMVREVSPPQKQAGAVATVSATMGVGGAIGLPLAAWITEQFSWHGLFWMSTGLAIVVFALTALIVPHVRDAHPAHIDVPGIIGLAAGLIAFLVGISKGSEWGWSSATTIGSIVGGILILILWGAFELRQSDPIVDLRSTANRPVLFTNLAAVAIGFGMMAQMIVVPQLLEMPEITGYGLGQSILAAGLWMAPGGLMMMVFAPVSSRLMNSIGARITLAIGAVVLSCGYLVGLFLMSAPWQLMLATLVCSAGVGIGYAAMPTLVMDNVPSSESGSAVGVNGLMRSVGTTIAGAVMAAILTSQTVSLMPGTPEIPSHDAFKLCFLVGAAAALLGAGLALCVSRAKTKTASLADAGEPSQAGEPEPARS
jgi:MFS family permease